MASFAELLVRIGGDATGFNTTMDQVSAKLDKTIREADKSFAGFDKLGQRLTSVGIGLTASLTAPLAGVGAASLEAAGKMEQASTAFTTLLKSAAAAEEHLNRLRDFALKTPFQFMELVDASKRMQAFGFSASEVIPMLTTIGNAVSALGGGSEVLNRVILAFGQIKAKGTAQAEEMRQLAEAGIPAWDALAKKLGVTIPEAMKLVEKRAVDSTTAIAALSEAMNERFGGGMENQAKTLLGLLSNVKDAITFTLADIGQTLLPMGKEMLNSIVLPVLDGLRSLAKGFAELPEPLQKTILLVMALVAALGPLVLIFGQMAFAINSILVILPTLSAAWTALTSGILSFTVACQAAILALGVVAGWKIGQWAYEQIPGFKAMGDAMADSLMWIPGVTALLDKMSGVSKKTAEASTDLSFATQKLEASLKAKGITVERGMKTDEQYAAALRQAAKDAGLLKNSTDTVSEATTKAQKTTVALIAEQKKHREEIERAYEAYGITDRRLQEMERQLGLLWEEYRRGKITIEQYAAAGQKLYDEAEKKRQAAIDAEKRYWDAIAKGWSDYVHSTAQVFLAFEKHWQEFQAETRKQVKITVDTFQLLPKEMQEAMLRAVDWAKRGAVGIGEAMKTIGTDALDAVQNLKLGTDRLNELGKTLPKHLDVAKESANEYAREVKKAFDHMARSMADNIIEWQGFGETLKNVAKDFAKGMLEILIQRLLDPFKNLLADLVGSITGSLGGILGGGGGSIWTGARSLGGGSVAGAGGGIGSAAAGASSSAAAWVGAAATGVSAAITAIGQARMEGTLNAIEKEARYAQIHLYYILEGVNAYLPKLADIHFYLLNQFQVYVEEINRQLVDRIAPGVEAIVARLDQLLAGGGIVSSVIPLISGGGSEPPVSDLLEEVAAGNLPAEAGQTVGGTYRLGGRFERPAGTRTATTTATPVVSSILSTNLGAQQAALEAARSLTGSVNEQDLIQQIAALRASGVAETDARLMQLEETLARLRNSGPEYQAWLQSQIQRTSTLISDAAQQVVSAVRQTATAARETASRVITINLQGGSIRDQEFADMVLSQFVREAKAGGLL